MGFAVATTEFWESVGFDTSNWRKSINEKMAIVHLQFAAALVAGLKHQSQMQVYLAPSAELTALLESAEWSGENNVDNA